ncbi:MAG: DUF488 domain-containing protein [Sulfurimonas sp.]|uniref:DUF488 domain-containing protein n=1 Tax=Sulfurimonas sp. TaxID=2022749 RepID=UPI0025D888E9|nr:DUF488 domain-containing protein [Sulfurimonas sp.]MCK9490737.1 DUF488 domain-containing protein [Sulfurimonas sp.]
MNKRTQPAFYRQKILLALLHAFGGKLSKLDLQKLLFLFVEEVMPKKKAYEFIPYHYGCYSFQANADLKTMHNYSFVDLNNTDNFIEEKENGFNPIQLLKEKDQNTLLTFFEKYKNLKGDELIAYVYKNYPYYTLNSKIAYKFLDKKYTKQPKLFAASENLFTIGYEGITFENYINKLIENDINILCDVRKNPFSMKFGFSKNILKHAVEQVGIKYIHLPELGIESENRQELNNLDDYKKLFLEYESTTLKSEGAQQALEYIGEIANEEKIALTCFEKDIEYCHRGVIAKSLKIKYGISYNNIS